MPYEEAPFYYSQSEARDPVAHLKKRLENGETSLTYEPEHGYLLSLLQALDIPLSSQVLVFSKTSLHRDLISPQHPRAIFFNDDVYVGWVQWAPVLEISAADPTAGAMFYVLPQRQELSPGLTRNQSCVECHVSQFSMGVPGHLVRSVETDETGQPKDLIGGARVSHNTPYEQRRGGWYVSGTHGEQPHLGNLFGREAFARHEQAPSFCGNQTDLSPWVEEDRYPTSHSDLVALMVLEHQVHMHNFLARLNYESRQRLQQYGHIRYVHPIAESFLQYLLFTEEPPLQDPVRGTSSFAESFQKRGPFDSQGRSLRQLDLNQRLFRYPCSYLIYSEAFEGLPAETKDYLYRRLWAILTNQDDSGRFEHVRTSTRRAILEILIDTKPGLPGYWKKEAIRANS